MFAHPINLQCFSILRDNAIFSPISVHAGLVKLSLATSALTPSTFAPAVEHVRRWQQGAVKRLLTGCTAYVYHQDFVLGQFGDLSLLSLLSIISF